jgi:hypothetical protein
MWRETEKAQRKKKVKKHIYRKRYNIKKKEEILRAKRIKNINAKKH